MLAVVHWTDMVRLLLIEKPVVVEAPPPVATVAPKKRGRPKKVKADGR